MCEKRTCGKCKHMGPDSSEHRGLHRCEHPQHNAPWPCTYPLTEPDIDATNCPGYSKIETPKEGK